MRRLLPTLLLAVLSAGCTTPGPMTMMPAPVLYSDAAIDPFAHLDDSLRVPEGHVYYLTNREAVEEAGGTRYVNRISDRLSFGEARVQMGPAGIDWESLSLRSLTAERGVELELSVAEISPIGTLQQERSDAPVQFELTPELQAFVDRINADLDRAVDREIMVYVHGTKVDFDNSALLTAEIDHFAGRDFVGVAFAWPSHQNILEYLVGVDVERARESSAALRALLTILARHSNAEHINVLSYSAGGRVTSKALYELRELHRDLTPEQLKATYRLGAVVFAAADVEIDTFLERLPDASALAQQVVITLSDDDTALIAAKKYMGGEVRAGTTDAEAREEELIVTEHLANVEILDVSRGKEVRGFDIDGHHYWYRHPWTSSDIIFLLRTDLGPARRGLTETEQAGVWYLSEEYPERVREAARRELLEGEWRAQ